MKKTYFLATSNKKKFICSIIELSINSCLSNLTSICLFKKQQHLKNRNLFLNQLKRTFHQDYLTIGTTLNLHKWLKWKDKIIMDPNLKVWKLKALTISKSIAINLDLIIGSSHHHLNPISIVHSSFRKNRKKSYFNQI